jgi:4-amino-4-deoxy-L-arabinose transferase-like glycosyltransferase
LRESSKARILKVIMAQIQVSIDRFKGWRLPRFRPRFGWLEASFLGLVLLALGTRLWELDGRAMHYDEAIHVYYAWRLSNLEEYIHAPWMHGPFQIEFTALILRLLGDNDFTARLGYVLFGSALVGLPYFLRDHLGRAGAWLTGVMLTVSPVMLYFSRFGRNDIIMAFWATALLVLAWRYIHEGRDRYLYLGSAVLAFMFATKETAYFVALIFGALTFLLALPDLAPLAFRRGKLSELAGPAGFFILILTLTLPQWSAISGLFQGFLGLTLANPEGVSRGIVGAPHWAGPFVVLPVYNAPWWLHLLAVAALAGGLLWLARKGDFAVRALITGVGIPLVVVAATILAVFRPIGQLLSPESPPLLVDAPLAGAIALAAVGVLIFLRHTWKQSVLLIVVPALLTLLYAALFTPFVNVASLVNGLLPGDIQVDATINGVPVNFVVASGILATAFLISIALGVGWRGGVWVACAVIFYAIWLTLYTTIFTNWAGFFSGIWQGMGYWIAQQDVARGNQPWYYYFVGLSVYELLPVFFGTLGAIYSLKTGNVFGLALAFWAGLTLLAYTLASEKMPWLLVNITLPFILLAGQYLGDLVERVPWRWVTQRGQVALLVLIPLGFIACVYLVMSYVNMQSPFSGLQWGVLTALALLAIVAAFLVRLARPPAGVALVGLATAVLLLAFGTWSAFRAAYTFDDSIPEILVYAQGSADLPQTYSKLDQQVFESASRSGAVRVDYEMWYPFQWYVRHEEQDGTLQFSCFKDNGDAGWNASCSPVPDDPDASALLLNAQHSNRDAPALTEYQREGPLRNLLWFPESYRRPGENRQAEGPGEELAKDFAFFKEAATSHATWQDALDYVIFRELERNWYTSEYYSYLP